MVIPKANTELNNRTRVEIEVNMHVAGELTQFAQFTQFARFTQFTQFALGSF